MGSRLSLVSHSLAGHRQAYIDQFSALATRAGILPRTIYTWRATLFDPAPVLFLMIEESLAGYVASALVRAATGRRTVGLMFRGREATQGRTSRLRLKRLLLMALRRVPLVSTLSIVPFSLEPRLAKIADGWIDDPQLWDLHDMSAPDTPLSLSVKAAAGQRRIVVSLGVQNEGKGFNFLTEAWTTDALLRRDWLFVAAGKTGPEVKAAAARFREAGGMLEDRFISDTELASLYGAAHVVWSVYSPVYDQASGIFGRAVQHNAPVLVRRGSLLEQHAKILQADARAIAFDDPEEIGAVLKSWNQVGRRSDATERNEARACRNIDALSRAISVSLKPVLARPG